MRSHRGFALWVGMALSAAGCAHYRQVQVPPEIDLTRFEAVGMIRFSSVSAPPGGLPGYATQRFIQQLTEGQPGIRVLELGSLEEALASVGKSRLDPDAIRALGAKANVQALFVGSLDVTQPQTSVNLFRGGLGVSANVTATLSATLYDTAQGATVWTRSATQRDTAGGGGIGGGTLEIEAGGQDTAYARSVGRAAFLISDAFRAHWVTERVD